MTVTGAGIMNNNANDGNCRDKLHKNEEGQVSDSSTGSSSCLCCLPCMKKHNELPPDPSCCQRIKFLFSLPPHGVFGWILTWSLVFFLVWAGTVSTVGDVALPGGNIFSLILLVLLCLAAGYVMLKLHLPPLLGMLIVGICFSNIPGVSFLGDSLIPKWSATLRKVALTVILIRAGLGLDEAALMRLKTTVVRLAFIPCLLESSTYAIVAHFLLGLPWLWAYLLGFVLGAVSPAVVVPLLLQLQEQGWGRAQGVPTLIIASATGDGALAILSFGVILSIIFSNGSLVSQILQGPIEIVMGVGYGVIVGFIMWIIPNKKDIYAAPIRFALLMSGGLLAVLGSKEAGYGGAGALGCLIMSFVAGIGWRRGGLSNKKNSVVEAFAILWTFFQPLLFGLIGTEIKVLEVEPTTIGWGVLTLLCGLSVRFSIAFIVTAGGHLTVKERIFVALAWLPKATVQAAIGSTALDTARALNAGDEAMALGKQILTIAVLAILIMAPIGALSIMISAPRLLKRDQKPSEC